MITQEQPYKIIVCGTRDFNDYYILETELDTILKDIPQRVEIVSGTSKGADKLGEKYARHTGLVIKRFPAKWSEYGKSAGPIRNEEMAKYANACVAFWDGKSKGTKNMIENARKYNLELNIIFT